VYSPDGTHILTASEDNTAKDWNRQTRKIIWATPPYDGVFIVDCSFKDCNFGNNEKLKELIRQYGGKD